MQPSSETLHCCFTIRKVCLNVFFRMEPHGKFLSRILCIDRDRAMLKTIKIKKVGFAFIFTGQQTFSDHVNHHSSSMITLRNHTAVHEWDQYQCREADNHSGNWDRMLLMCIMTRQDNTTINVCLCHQLLIMLLYLESKRDGMMFDVTVSPKTI